MPKIITEKVYYIVFENGSRVGPFHDQGFAESVVKKAEKAEQSCQTTTGPTPANTPSQGPA
jgi:hypothetical protein